MSVKYRLVERNNMGKDKEETPKKLYAQPVYSDLVGFEELLGEISEAGIPSNQVKGVMDRMNYLIKKHLAAGRRVQFGESETPLRGGSTGAAEKEEFQTNMIKIPRIIFSPGATLRKARKDANFERKEEIVTKNDGGGNGGGDRPEIE